MLFDETITKQIINDFEEVKDSVDSVIIHCLHRRNCSPVIGNALNEVCNLGYQNLKEQFPFYRRFVYEKMLSIKKQDS